MTSHVYEIIMNIPRMTGHQKIMLALIGPYSSNGRGYELGFERTAVMLGMSVRNTKRVFYGLRDKNYIISSFPGSPHANWFLLENEKTKPIMEKLKWTTPSVEIIQKKYNESLKQEDGGVKETDQICHSVGTNTDSVGTNTDSTVPNVARISKEDKNNKKLSGEKPVCNNKSFSSETTQPTGSNHSFAFDEFWAAYPRKEKRKEAERAWDELNPDPTLAERIIKNVQRRSQTFDWQKESCKYVPLAENYLRDQRWEDEIKADGDFITPIQRGPDGLTPRERALREYAHAK